jgi:hypothetical protein
MLLYHIASIAKAVLWAVILLVTYTTINIYQDPVIAIAMAFVGIFIFTRGISFYFFIGMQRLLRPQIQNNERLVKDSYKLSLLFGIFCLINVWLILLWNWNTIIGLLLLIGFIVLQAMLFKNQSKEAHGE